MTKYLHIFICIFICTTTSASIRRVGFNGTPVEGVDYSTFVAALTAANNGDTIQIYGVVILRGKQTVNKRLTIIGFGYNFDVNPGLQANGIDAPSSFTNGALIFDVGSENSVIQGCDFQTGANALDVANSKITIRRCCIPYIFNKQSQDEAGWQNVLMFSNRH